MGVYGEGGTASIMEHKNPMLPLSYLNRLKCLLILCLALPAGHGRLHEHGGFPGRAPQDHQLQTKVGDDPDQIRVQGAEPLPG